MSRCRGTTEGPTIGLMSVQLQAATVASVVGIVSGSIGSLIAPWVQWRIEKVRLKQARRVETLEMWRNGLAAAEASNATKAHTFLSQRWYLSLRPELPHDVASRLDNSPQISGVPMQLGAVKIRRDDVAVELNNEIDRIPRRWQLL
jgi:hypothetical protein